MSGRLPYRPTVSIEDASRAMGRESIRAHRRAFGSDQLERDMETLREEMEEDALDEPCDECGQAMRLHTEEYTGPFYPNGVPMTTARTVYCPEPIPADDSEGRDEA